MVRYHIKHLKLEPSATISRLQKQFMTNEKTRRAMAFVAEVSLSAFAGLLVIFVFLNQPQLAQAQAVTQPPNEVRALWVVRTTLMTPEKIHKMVESARNAGFNTLIVQVRGRGDAYYQSRW